MRAALRDRLPVPVAEARAEAGAAVGEAGAPGRGPQRQQEAAGVAAGPAAAPLSEHRRRGRSALEARGGAAGGRTAAAGAGWSRSAAAERDSSLAPHNRLSTTLSAAVAEMAEAIGIANAEALARTLQPRR